MHRRLYHFKQMMKSFVEDIDTKMAQSGIDTLPTTTIREIDQN